MEMDFCLELVLYGKLLETALPTRVYEFPLTILGGSFRISFGTESRSGGAG